MSDVPLSEQAPPAIERGEPVGYSLGPDFMTLASHMAATMLPGLISNATTTLDEDASVALSVRMAIGIANEIRTYRLVDNKAVKLEKKEPDA